MPKVWKCVLRLNAYFQSQDIIEIRLAGVGLICDPNRVSWGNDGWGIYVYRFGGRR